MLDRVLFDINQKAVLEDFNALGEFPRDTFDAIGVDLLIPGAKFTGFSVAQNGASAVRVGAGRLYENGKAYYNDTPSGVAVDLLGALPVINQRWVTITVYPDEQPAEPEPRTYLTNATTRAVQAQTKPTVIRRWASVDKVLGELAAEPDKKPAPAGHLEVAYVLIDPTGIIRIDRATDNIAPNLEDEDRRLRELDEWRNSIAAILDTLKSDIAGLSARLGGLANANFVNQIAADLARAKEKLKLPSSYSSYHADYFLGYDHSDPTYVDWSANVEEGIRYGDASVQETQLALFNQFNADVAVENFFVLPAYKDVLRTGIFSTEVAQKISAYPYQTVDYVQKTMTRSRWRYGPTFMLCSNWLNGPDYIAHAGYFDPISSTFRFWSGEIWEILDTQAYMTGDYLNVRARGAWLDYYEESYWEWVVTKRQASGSIMGNTFLNSQDGWITRIGVTFAGKGTSGDVTCLICNADTGEPDITKVIAIASVTTADIKVYPSANYTFFEFEPTFLHAGKRYAFVLITGGNHTVYLALNNKFNQGTLFYITDGRWASADPARDISFQLWFAQFTSPRVEVPMMSLNLDQGIAAIDLLASTIMPPQTEIRHLIRVPPAGQWIDLEEAQLKADEDGLHHPLAQLPPNVEHKIVLVGTTASMPGFGVGANSRVRTRRPNSTFKHISEPITCPLSNKITLKLRIENWYSTRHTMTLFLMKTVTNPYDTNVAPSSRVDTVAPDDPHALLIEAVWNLGTPNSTMGLTQFRWWIEGNTNNLHVAQLVAERVDIEQIV